jgi:hypothetical protein
VAVVVDAAAATTTTTTMMCCYNDNQTTRKAGDPSLQMSSTDSPRFTKVCIMKLHSYELLQENIYRQFGLLSE